MSRIGNKIIVLPAGVSVSVAEGNVVSVKGPKGTLHQTVDSDISVEIEGSELKVSRPTEQKRHKALHGLYRSLINNMVIGVDAGYKKELEIIGVGYKASAANNVLELQLGYSHNIFMAIPQEIKLTTTSEKGQNPKVILEGIDKELIGSVAAKIKSLRKVEPYKGKGIRFVGEVVRRKAGKSASKK
ncbi:MULTISPECIES: 50S ribosomal protein L6 [Dyadobacter]|jgi:large subunit ribosomal protein L6|uniref:Large ribosomal subunit protein uL6 n=2 Tax=Dyadobacter TaxID=120831 RepID=A0A9X1P711_9BACT|nr:MULTISPECIES: 50S ribosomal protein L6 [Dyadobacter]MCF0038864.1 50S ribosomal protein L6 [Dyadobacter fanqingshengii]MCF0053110.1 50S ribosomal protein L6 [Dyadobacter chenwenxiniae]MCF0061592.1 50S ribosomal protein L6 [Dyadobacter chenwenxiniae]UON81415.1 50S ribosomal protein L6 [Dyadobacter chenwenxiniae]USJ34311.1 50S ribosomal protein L6 [Dyadobacter fanqingshengii]